MLVFAASTWQIFAFGALMSLGSAAFASANWALMADLVPKNEPARFFGLANIGTAGAAAAAGLFGPLIDGLNTARPGLGYPALFAAASLMFILSALVMRSVNQPAEVSRQSLVIGLIREEINMQTQKPASSWPFAFRLPDYLAYLYQPIWPYLKKIKIHREGEQHPNPNDILLPEGYTAEVVATGLNTPTHCTFDDAGNCYVAESGHKIDSPPRIVKVELKTGKKEVLAGQFTTLQ